MSAPTNQRRWRDPALTYLGAQAAEALVAGDPGDADGGSGWRGALQTAATVTDNDPSVLRIADELYAAAADITTRSAVRSYAISTSATIADGPALCLLYGMLSDASDTKD